MSWKEEISYPPDTTNTIISEINVWDGLINLQVLKGASVNLPGDVVTATITTGEISI